MTSFCSMMPCVLAVQAEQHWAWFYVQVTTHSQ